MLCASDKAIAGSKTAVTYLLTIYQPPRHPIPESLATYDPGMYGKLEDHLRKYEGNFTRHMEILHDALDFYAATETIVLSRLCAQLSLSNEHGTEGRMMQ